MQNVEGSLQNAVIRMWICTSKHPLQESALHFFFLITFLPDPKMMMIGGCEHGSCLARGCPVHTLGQLGQVTASGTVPGSAKLAVPLTGMCSSHKCEAKI